MDTANCEKCKASNVAGTRYCFHYGKVLSVKQMLEEFTAQEVKVSTSARYRIEGSEEVFICDRCIAETVARDQFGGAILLSGLLAFGVVLCLALAYGASWWWLIGALVCGLFGILPVLTIRDVAEMRRILANPSSTGVLALPQMARLFPPDKTETALQNVGDQQAAELRKDEWMKNGMDLFFSRQTYQQATEAATNNTDFDVLRFQESGPWRRKLAPIVGVVVGVAAGVGVGFLMSYLREGNVEPFLWLFAIIVAPLVGFLAFAAIRWVRL